METPPSNRCLRHGHGHRHHSRQGVRPTRSTPLFLAALSLALTWTPVACQQQPEQPDANSHWTHTGQRHSPFDSRGAINGGSVCSATPHAFVSDPALNRMTYDLGYGPSTFNAYVQPDVSEFYVGGGEGKKAVRPDHQGCAAKFINMSNQVVRLWWDGGQNASLIATIPPFESGGTASFPTHKFYLTPADDANRILQRFLIAPPNSLYFYDPITVHRGNEVDDEATQRNLDKLDDVDFAKYERHFLNRRFGEKYLEFTGRDYLSFYPRKRPSHKMWRADHFGQEHWVVSRETHFVDMPEERELKPITETGKKRVLKEKQPRHLQQYRTPDQLYLNMTLKVVSCAPRAFEIEHFLSQTEVDHIMHLTTGMSLKRSTTAGGVSEGRNQEEDGKLVDDTRNTRTSLNTWVNRDTSPIIDAIYRRAADVLRIDETLFRHRDTTEYPDLGTRKSIAEALQLVHYEVGQEYTAHHDFGYANIDNPYQPARFSTLLLYLNEGMEGGSTEFPRYVNADSGRALGVVPKVGKAVLFYSQLPDGNMDDLSHHAAMPVRVGEKWLMNLWVWDPIYED